MKKFFVLMGMALSASVLAQNVVLKAATAKVGTRTEVRLRWLVRAGWIPEKGYQLMRVDGKPRQIYPAGVRKPTNLDRFKIAPPKASVPKLPSAPPPVDLTQLMAAAKRPAPPVPFLGGPDRPRLGSQSVFLARKNESIAFISQPTSRPEQLPMNLNRLDAVRSHFSKVNFPPSVKTLSANPQEQTFNARRAVMFAAMVFPEISEEVGIAATDTSVTVGTTAKYQLFEILANGQPGPAPIATLDFPVTNDTAPPTPTGFDVLQSGVQQMEFRWNRLEPGVEQNFGVARYRISRVVGTTSSNLTPEPLVIADSETAAGDVEPYAFFVDAQAPVGSVTYRLTLMDSFGRESEAATLIANVADLRTPPKPEAVLSRLLGNNSDAPPVKLLWEPNDPQAVYQVLRQDLDANSDPVLLTANPISGQTLVASDARDVAFAERRLGVKGSSQKTTKIATKVAKMRSFTDATAQTDKRYRYFVQAIYAFNNRRSDPTESAIVEVPTLVPPPAPGGLQISGFAPAAKPNRKVRGSEMVKKPSKFENPIRKDRFTGLSKTGSKLTPVTTPAADIGGSWTLTWQAPAGQLKPKFIVFREIAGVPGSRLEIGQTDRNQYLDRTPRAHKVDYVYSIMTVNRWGIKGASASLPASTRSTLNPSIPRLRSVSPDPATGGIFVKWKPNAAEEQVKTYRVFRKSLPKEVASVTLPIWEPGLQDIRRQPKTGPLPKGRISPGNPLRPKPPAIERGKLKAPGILDPASNPNNDSGYTAVGTVNVQGNEADLQFLDAAANPDQRHFYKLVAVNELSFESERTEPLGSEGLKMTADPPLQLAVAPAPAGLVLTWRAPNSGAKAYVVLRGSAANGPFKAISGQVTALTFTDKAALKGRSYFYVVRAVDAFGNLSAGTAPVNGSIPRS